MAKGIDISIAADTKSAMSAIKRGLIEPLEDVTDILDDVGDDGKKSTDKLEKGMRDAQRRTDDAKDEIRDLRDELNKAGRAGKKSGDDIDDGMAKASENAAEFKQEALQNLSEVTSSFDGSVESFQDLIQGTLGGVASSIPGIGLAAAGAAVGIGLIGSAFVQADEERQRLEDRAAGLADAYIEAGNTVLDTITLASRVSEVLTDEEQRKDAQKMADIIGISLPEAARILAGDTNALAAAQDVLAGKEDSLNEKRETGKLLTEQEAAAVADQQLVYDDAANTLDKYSANNDKAAQTARDYSIALLGMIEDAGTGAVEVDKLGNKLITLPDKSQVMIEAETGAATTNIDKFAGDYDGVIVNANAKDIVLSAATSQAIAAARRAADTIGNMSATIDVDANTYKVRQAIANAISSATSILSKWD